MLIEKSIVDVKPMLSMEGLVGARESLSHSENCEMNEVIVFE
jgi:hypothetical protein